MEERNWMSKAEVILVFGIPAPTLRNWLREGKLKPSRGKMLIQVEAVAFGLDEIKKIARMRREKPDFTKLSADKKEFLNWRMMREEIQKARKEN